MMKDEKPIRVSIQTSKFTWVSIIIIAVLIVLVILKTLLE